MADTTTTRRARLVVLLENYIDVVNGLRDKTGDGVHLPLMCRAWNHESYEQLEYLRLRMRAETPPLYRELQRRYFDEFGMQRRVKSCQVVGCAFEVAAWSSTYFHRHRTKRGMENVALVPKTVRVYSGELDEERHGRALAWLDGHWEGGVFLPDELMRKEAA